MKIKKYFAELIIIPLALIFAVLIVLIHTNPGQNRTELSEDPYYTLKPEGIEKEAIGEYAGIRYTYTFILPDLNRENSSDLRLTAFLRHTYACFTVEDSAFQYEITETDEPHIGITPGKYWLSIPIRPEFSGKKATLTLTPVFSGAQAENPEFLLIRRDTLLTSMELPLEGLLLALGAFSVIAGLILAVIILFIPAESREKKLVFYIGMVTVLAGLWKLSGIPLFPLLLENLGIHKEIWYCGTGCYLLMLVLSLRMMCFMGKETTGKYDMICTCISGGAAFVLFILQIFNVLELHEAVIWFGVGSAILHLIALLRKKSGKSEWLWMLPFFLTMSADLLVTLWTGSIHNAYFFLIWMILNLIVRGFGFIRQAVLRERMMRKKEEELRDARVKSMMNQIRPHFIYNTLASIYLLCREDPDKAATVVNDFTEYLQGNFSAVSAANPVSFSEELRHTQAYLAVEKALYTDKLQIELNTDFTAFRLPPLTLQPLVENAVKHCVNRSSEPLHISVRTRYTDQGIELLVEDNGPGFDPSDESRPHTTLTNIRQRLEMMCGGSMDISPRDGGGTVVKVIIPSSPPLSG